MKRLNKNSRFLPYLYFIAVITYWFTEVNRTEGLTAFPILLFGLPFLWQLLRPSKKMNLALGITFMCLSSYMIIIFLSDAMNLTSITVKTKNFMIYGSIFTVSNLIMALWMIKNSLHEVYK